MNSSSIKDRIKVAVAVAAAVALTAGCKSTEHHARYKATSAPVTTAEAQSSQQMTTTTTAAGGTGAQMETQAGAGSGNVVIPLQQEQLLVGTAQVNEGSIQVRKEVKTETVNQPVQVRKETVTIERLPAGQGPTTGQPTGGEGSFNQPFKEGEITIPLTKEVPIAQTQTVPGGAVVIKKQYTTEPTTIQREVRHEDVVVTTNMNANAAQGAPGTATYQSSGGGAPITDWQQLTATSDPTILAGSQVNLSSVKVEKVISDRCVALAGPGGKTLYVRTSQPVSGLSPGQSCQVKGTIRTTSSGLGSGLDQASMQAMQSQPIFIDATSLEAANQ